MPTQSEPVMLINGVPGDQVAATDRGLNYGDGVFRTLRVQAHEPQAWTTQMACLRRDCLRLDLPVPDADVLLAEARRLFAHTADGVLKIVVTRGSGGRGYVPPQNVQPVRIVSAHPLPPSVETLALEVSSIRFACQPALAGVKHLNRLEQVLARTQCARNDWPDALMLDGAGRVISTTMRNVLLCLDGVWHTPSLQQAGVAGATRERLLAACHALGQPVVRADCMLSDCYAASAMIACNSVSGVTPIIRLGTHELHHSVDMAVQCRYYLAAVQESN